MVCRSGSVSVVEALGNLHGAVELRQFNLLLRECIGAGAELGLVWSLSESGESYRWTVGFEITSPGDPVDRVELEELINHKADFDATESFTESEKNRADESEPFEKCEDRLIERFELEPRHVADVTIVGSCNVFHRDAS